MFRDGALDVMLRALRLAGEERRHVVLIVVLGLVSAVFEGFGLSLIIPIAQIALASGEAPDLPHVGSLIRSLSGDDTSAVPLMVAAAAIFLAGLIIGVVNLVLSTRLSLVFAERLRAQIFETLMHQDIVLLEGKSSGKLMNIMATESWRACDALFVAISPFHALLLAVLTTLMALSIASMTRRVRHLGARATAANEGLTTYLFNLLNGLRVVRGFGREMYERRRFLRRSSKISFVFMRLTVLTGLIGPLVQLMTLGIVIILGLVSLARGDEAAVLIGFLAIAYRVQLRVASVLSARAGLLGFEAPIAEIENAIGHLGTIEEKGHPLPPLAREIRMENVTVRYPMADVAAVTDISCSFRVG